MLSKQQASELRALVDLRQSFQKSRISFGLRVGAIERGVDQDTKVDDTEESEFLPIPGTGSELFKKYSERFLALEKETEGDIKDLVREMPIIQAMTTVKGVGLLLAAKVVAMVDIERSETISKLWRYSGYAAIDGQRERPVKGEKLHYNSRLKTTCHLVGLSFIRTNSPYRRLYDEAKVKYERTHPEWTPLHRHNAALRYMIKIWLSHVWLVWRRMEGLSIREPYIIATSEAPHQAYTPQEFGWDLEAKPKVRRGRRPALVS